MNSRYLILAISILFLGCAKEEGAGITSFNGQDIDSVCRYYIDDNNDTTLEYVWKYSYPDDKNNIVEKMYSRVGADDTLTQTSINILEIKNQKLTIIDYFVGGFTTWIYRFNKNKYVTSRVITQSITSDLDSTSYEYYNEGYLHNVNTIRFKTREKNSILFSTDTKFYWSNGNLDYTISTGSAPVFNPNEKYYKRYQYNELINPLGYSYDDDEYMRQPYLKFGKASKNLISNYKSKDDHNSDININYSYTLSPNTNSFIKRNHLVTEKGGAFTKIFYK